LADLLTGCLKRLALAAEAKRLAGRPDREADRLLVNGLTATGTSANFDPMSLSEMVTRAESAFERISMELGRSFELAPDLKIPRTMHGREAAGGRLPLGSFPEIEASLTPQIVSMRESAIYALKGAAGYASQALSFGREDEEVYERVERVLAMGLDSSLGLSDWLEAFLGVGRTGLRAMEILDEAHTTTFGHPEPTLATLGRKMGKAVLVSGHSLGDLAKMLEQAGAFGVSLYTHGEMLAAHGYPLLKSPALAGHYGTSWPNQDDEFRRFPGPMVLAGGCLRRPHPAYRERVFCTSTSAWPGAARIEADSDGHKDFGPVFEAALKAPGFSSGAWGPFVPAGWGRKALLERASRIASLLNSGRVRSLLIVGGCDGTKSFRVYYRRLVELSPADSLILAMGCGKARFLDLNLGEIDGVPRLLDLGQCGDAYSAIVFIASLAKIMGRKVKELPVSAFLSWYEQKPLAILAALMDLGIGDISLGPSFPAFMNPEVCELLFASGGPRPVTDPEGDLSEAMSRPGTKIPLNSGPMKGRKGARDMRGHSRNLAKAAGAPG
jgi:hydroxylamine reductase